jgi:alpha-beta hydrolase superfamily lysophospholipase
MASVLLPNIAAAQSAPKDKAGTAKAKQAAPQGSQRKELRTDDGVLLTAYYWAAKEPSDDTPVVVLVHDRGRTQRDWFPLASQLQSDGFAVVSFDFRGHGLSKEVVPDVYKHPKDAVELERQKAARERSGQRLAPPRGNSAKRTESRRTGKPTASKIDQKEEFRTGKEFALFAARDLERIKQFLIVENNGKRLNLKRMSIVAAGAGATVAGYWAEEYEHVERGTGLTRQGGDLLAMVFVSPAFQHDGLKMTTNLVKSAPNLAVMVLSSAKGRDADESVRTARAFKIPVPVEGKSKSPAKEAEKAKTAKPTAKASPTNPSTIHTVDSKLTGSELVSAEELKLDAKIRKFLITNVVEKSNLEWEQRDSDDKSESSFGGSR